jgi:hypothetical protein
MAVPVRKSLYQPVGLWAANAPSVLPMPAGKSPLVSFSQPALNHSTPTTPCTTGTT